MPNKPSIFSTRQSTCHFLIGQEQNDLGKEAISGKLPRTRFAMQYMLFRKILPQFKVKPVSTVICCPLMTWSTNSYCATNPDCTYLTQCVVFKVKDEGRWLESGTPIIKDLAISKKLVKLNEEFRNLVKPI